MPSTAKVAVARSSDAAATARLAGSAGAALASTAAGSRSIATTAPRTASLGRSPRAAAYNAKASHSAGASVMVTKGNSVGISDPPWRGT